MSRFRTKTIEEVTQDIIDYRGKTPPKVESGIKLITAKVIKDGFIKEERSEYISEETYNSWMRRGYPKLFDVLLTTEAPLGEVAQIRKEERIALAQRVILLRGNPNLIDQQYFFQALKSPFVKAGLEQRASGTTVLGIKQSELRQVAIPYPPLPTQRKIASILSAYDDLIENNLRRIKILEEMAQNLYREWFVKFHFPGHENVRFVDSPLGRIPEGWEVKRLGDLVELAYGKGLKKEDRISGNIPVYGSGGIVGYHNSALVEGPGIIVGRKGNVGSIFWSSRNFFPIDTVFYVITHVDLHYTYYNLSEQNFINTDAAVPGLSRNQSYSNSFLFPSNDVLSKFGDIIKLFFNLIDNLKIKSQNLRQTRDILLPKLISGEVDVSELDVTIPEENL
jgi:type I restriction enzyme, S subunit